MPNDHYVSPLSLASLFYVRRRDMGMSRNHRYQRKLFINWGIFMKLFTKETKKIIVDGCAFHCLIDQTPNMSLLLLKSTHQEPKHLMF